MQTDGDPRRLIVLGLLVALFAIAGCDNTGSVNPSPSSTFEGFQAGETHVPSLWVYGSTTFREVSFQIDLSQATKEAILAEEIAAPVVMVRIVPPSGTPVRDVRLLDDGGALVPPDTSGFLAPASGDLVPHDYRYSFQINSMFATEEGAYEFRFVAASGDTAATSFDNLLSAPEHVVETVSAEVAVNRPPVIDGSASSLPDSLFSGFSPEIWSLVVSDPDASGGDVVESVSLQVLDGSSVLRNLILTNSGTNLWTILVDSSFTAGISTGNLTFRFSASDRFQEMSVPLDTLVWVENLAPVLNDPVAPDTVFIPQTDSNLYTLSVRVSDPQGSGDLANVYYTVESPQGTVSTNPAFVFSDNGVSPDVTANDGIWTTGISVASTNTNTGTWIFRFYGEDRVSNTSQAVTVPIVMEFTP